MFGGTGKKCMRTSFQQFYFACIMRCIWLCHYYQGEHNNSEKPEKREKTKD